ncbi:hypothetical protein PAMA_015639 [Pampus argenteus]
MTETEVNYASVVFKTKTHSPPEAEQQETVYNEVKTQNQTAQQAADINTKQEVETVYDEVKVRNQPTKQAADINNMKLANRRHGCQKLACCLGILCVILLLGITATCVYFSKHGELKERSLLVINHNLTDQNNKLTSENEHLMEKNDNLTVYVGNLTQAYTVSESKLMNLTAENQQLKTQNQQLETQRNNLTEQIRDAEIKWVEQNVSRAQWSVDAYCPLKKNKRQCKPCQLSWLFNQTSCYAINNAARADRKTWEEAREDCRGKISDLAVIDNENAKKFINTNSWGSSGTNGYWIGLRVEDGRWKWINGSDLTDK